MDANTRTVVVREGALDAAVERGGFGSLSALAAAAHIAPSTLTRIARGETQPGSTAIAALIATSHMSFDELFTVSGARPHDAVA